MTTIVRFALSLFLSPLFVTPGSAADTLKVCATTPDLGGLAQKIGGDRIELTVFATGTEDPHFVEPRPSFIRALSRADVLLLTGMGYETGWVPPLLKSARNARIRPGSAGHVDASTAIDPVQVPTTPVDRSMGDVHPYGNPHYMMDPLRALRVAALLRDRFSDLRPESSALFEKRYDDFRSLIGEKLVGAELAGLYDFEKLALLFEHGKLRSFLEDQEQLPMLDGWLAAVLPHAGVKAVGDHNMWPYFAARFRIDVVGHMEPKPGIPPTTSHLRKLIERMKEQNVRLVLASAYYDPRHARFVSQHTGARVARIAHQVGARPGTDDYFSMIDHNVREIVDGLTE